jgi:hypothetical protein
MLGDSFTGSQHRGVFLASLISLSNTETSGLIYNKYREEIQVS